MANKTQLRLGQMTGSFAEVAGGITDSRAAGSATLASIQIQSGSMVGIMSEVVSSIKRMHGAGSFAANAVSTLKDVLDNILVAGPRKEGLLENLAKFLPNSNISGKVVNSTT